MNQVQKEQGDIDYEFYIGLSSHLVFKLSSAEPNPWIGLGIGTLYLPGTDSERVSRMEITSP